MLVLHLNTLLWVSLAFYCSKSPTRHKHRRILYGDVPICTASALTLKGSFPTENRLWFTVSSQLITPSQNSLTVPGRGQEGGWGIGSWSLVERWTAVTIRGSMRCNYISWNCWTHVAVKVQAFWPNTGPHQWKNNDFSFLTDCNTRS